MHTIKPDSILRFVLLGWVQVQLSGVLQIVVERGGGRDYRSEGYDGDVVCIAIYLTHHIVAFRTSYFFFLQGAVYYLDRVPQSIGVHFALES